MRSMAMGSSWNQTMWGRTRPTPPQAGHWLSPPNLPHRIANLAIEDRRPADIFEGTQGEGTLASLIGCSLAVRPKSMVP